MNALRAAVVFFGCSFFTNNPFIQLLVTVAVMLLVFYVQLQDPRLVEEVDEDPLDAPLSAEEAAILNQGKPLEITDVSEEAACMYLGKSWPVWIEIDNDLTYMYDGPWDGKCEAPFQLSEEIIILNPGVQYKLVYEEDADKLHAMLVKSD